MARRSLLPARLPQLSRRGQFWFRLAWLAALAVAAVAPVGGAVVRVEGYPVLTGMRAASLAIDLLPPVLLIATAILLYLRRGGDVVAALLSLSFLLMSGAFFAAEGFFRALDLTWVRDLLAHAGRVALLSVLLTFPDGRFSPRWTALVALALLVWGPVAFTRPFPLDAEYIGYLLFLALSVLAMTTRFRALDPGREREQIRWVLFGFAAGTGLLVLAVGATFLVARQPLVAQTLAASGMACFALGLIVSLLRYRLYDADAAISRSAAYAMLTVFLGAVFTGSSEGAKIFIESSLGRDAGALPSVIAAGMAAVLLTPANNLVGGWAERRFQKRLTALRRDLPECMADLRETATMAELLDELLARLAAGIRAGQAAVLIGDEIAATHAIGAAEVTGWRAANPPDPEARKLDCERDDPLFPLRLPLRIRHGAGAPIGWVLLGERPDGSVPGKDDRAVLAEIADPIARALQVVWLREQREAKQEERLRAIERRLAAFGDSADDGGARVR